MYPKTKIHISLLLPTKDTSLNFKVNQLNKGLKTLASNHRNLVVIEHHNLLDQFGFLNPILGRYKRGIPNPNDHVHLGPNGIKRFVNSVKSMILHKRSPLAMEGNNVRIQPTSFEPRATQPSSHPLWSLSDCAGPSSQTQYPAFPPAPYPEPIWAHSPAPRQVPTPGHPIPGLGYGNHHGRARYNSHFPPLTSDGYQS